MNDSTDCAICLTPIENNELHTLPCNHSYHQDCINEWAKTSQVQIENNEVHWYCPLCRHVMKEELSDEEIEESFFVFSVVTFRSKRFFIQVFTFCDACVSFISFIMSDNILYLIWVMCSMYGYCGANNFNVYHLKFYAWCCLFPVTFKSLTFNI